MIEFPPIQIFLMLPSGGLIEKIQLGVNLFTALVVFAGVITGVVGLGKWKTQLRGNKQYEFAHQVFRMIREAVDSYHKFLGPIISMPDKENSIGYSEILLLQNRVKDYEKASSIVFQLARMDRESKLILRDTFEPLLDRLARCLSRDYGAYINMSLLLNLIYRDGKISTDGINQMEEAGNLERYRTFNFDQGKATHIGEADYVMEKFEEFLKPFL